MSISNLIEEHDVVQLLQKCLLKAKEYGIDVVFTKDYIELQCRLDWYSGSHLVGVYDEVNVYVRDEDVIIEAGTTGYSRVYCYVDSEYDRGNTVAINNALHQVYDEIIQLGVQRLKNLDVYKENALKRHRKEQLAKSVDKSNLKEPEKKTIKEKIFGGK